MKDSLNRIWTIIFSQNFKMKAMPLGLLKKGKGFVRPEFRISSDDILTGEVKYLTRIFCFANELIYR